MQPPRLPEIASLRPPYMARRTSVPRVLPEPDGRVTMKCALFGSF